MPRSARRKSTGRPLVAALTLVLGMAGLSAAGEEPPLAVPQGPPPSRVIVYRPVISALMRPKTLYISNYAGVNYPPLGQRGLVAPTSGWTRPARPFGWLRRGQ